MRLSKQDVQRIVEEQMPNFKVVQTPESLEVDAAGRKPRAKPEAHTPDAETLRKKYLREKFIEGTDTSSADEGTPNGAPAADAADDDTEIVLVEPKTAPHPLDRGSRPKAVVISTKNKKIIGTQG